jgi:hypothetical protein
MRRLLIGLGVAFGLAAFAPTVRAQGAGAFSPGFSDPFFLYYGFFLPRQAALSAQPTTANQLVDVAAARQNYALADRAGLYDPNVNNPFAMDTDPLNPFPSRRGAERLPPIPPHFIAPRSQSRVDVPYFNRAGRYFPTLRTGSNANQNVVGSNRYARAGVAGYGGFGGLGVPGRR